MPLTFNWRNSKNSGNGKSVKTFDESKTVMGNFWKSLDFEGLKAAQRSEVFVPRHFLQGEGLSECRQLRNEACISVLGLPKSFYPSSA